MACGYEMHETSSNVQVKLRAWPVRLNALLGVRLMRLLGATQETITEDGRDATGDCTKRNDSPEKQWLGYLRDDN
ncbi:hypothetical protein FACS189497_07010 [Betaproteobacteria bacterium]|nr:hypothetical protein FACS189488_14030 [Betaproteobacteria bacterium]GHU29295.1 hypothetical protein FACS189497_07010 [Betaproteobacteria bacterium]